MKNKMKKAEVKKILDKAIENQDFLMSTRDQFTEILTGDCEELTDQEKITIEVGFYCNRCKNMEININCSYCLPLKADKINEYLRQQRKMHDFYVMEKSHLCDRIEYLEERLEKEKDE